MSEDEKPQESGIEATADFGAMAGEVCETIKNTSARESIASPTQDLATGPDAETPSQSTPRADADEATTRQQMPRPASVGRDINVAGRDLTVLNNNYGPDLADLESVRLFSKSQRTEVTNSYLQQAVKQAEITFRMSIWFITAGGIVILAAVILGLIHPSTPHSVSFVSGLAGLLIGSGGGAFAIRADKSRKHLAQAMTQMDAEVQEERRFAQEAWRYAQATKAISDIRDDGLNDQARVQLAQMILRASQPPAETPTPASVHPAIQQDDDTPQKRPT